jgi:hypothetical protein
MERRFMWAAAAPMAAGPFWERLRRKDRLFRRRRGPHRLTADGKLGTGKGFLFAGQASVQFMPIFVLYYQEVAMLLLLVLRLCETYYFYLHSKVALMKI